MNINELKSKSIVITGGMNGLLGPVITGIFAQELDVEICFFDLPLSDLSKFEDIENFVADVGCPAVVVHNAAIDPKPGTGDGTNPFRNHEKIMKVNHSAVARMNELLIPKMIENGGGIIIIMGSIMGYVSANPDNYQDGWAKAFGYNESKAALQMHCHNINTIFGKQGIRCVMPSFGPYEQGLSPAFMQGFGKKIPLQHPVSKNDIIATIKYCIECDSIAGEFRVDGGYTRVGR